MGEYHIPVMVNEVIKYLNIKPNGVYLDLTFGGGGHTKEILKHLTTGHLYGFDQDQDAKIEAEKINDDHFTFIHANARFVRQFMTYYNITTVDGIFADLGVSSHQIDCQERGFSIRLDAKLDMRMNSSSHITAYDIVNNYQQNQLEQILSNYGELYCSSKIAQAICQARKNHRIATTYDLITVIENIMCINPKYKQKFFAQIFQALRIEVNDELNILKEYLSYLPPLLGINGRLIILTYHSLEDRIVKKFFRLCDNNDFKILTPKPLTPTKIDIDKNIRAHSAKMRILQRLK